MTKLRIVQNGVRTAARIGRALAHPLRIRALAALRERELCVCELIALFDLAPSTVSKHMSIMADAGLVSRRRNGKWTYYSLPVNADPWTTYALNMVWELTEHDAAVMDDLKKISSLGCCPED